jgi:hypothetical protein
VKVAGDLFTIPRLPQWLCRLTGHGGRGYLTELRRIDETESEYECRSCGWRGVQGRPPQKIRWHWF